MPGRASEYMDQPRQEIDQNRRNEDKKGMDGRSERRNPHPISGVRLEFENKNGSTVLYGTLLGGPYYNPSKGVQFLFEGAYTDTWDGWKYGVWKVSIEGPGLTNVWHDLSVSKEEFVKAGYIDEVKGERTIEVKPFDLPGYPPR
ncbi:hypothetical protein BH10PLA2_BH10PLA2_08350 [soil metagenome]